MSKKSSAETINMRLQNTNRNLVLIGPYINGSTKTPFKCLICDYEWNTLPDSVLCGSGCPICSGKISTIESINKRLEKENKPLRIIDNFTKRCKKALFKCLICDHEWETTPYGVLHNNSMCPVCKINNTLNEINKKIEDRKLIFHEYNGASKNSKCQCLECNHIWYPTTHGVVNHNSGCPICSDTKLSKEIVNERLINENRSLRLIGEYINNRTKLLFKCLVCDHEWEAIPNNILSKTGCPCCAKYGFDPSKPAYLYYIKILYDGWYYYKIGITNNSIEERFTKSDFNKIQEILIYDYYDIGKNAQEKEQLILKEFKEYRYNGEPILKSNGNSEIFICDIREYWST